jgi:hypothetical protein
MTPVEDIGFIKLDAGRLYDIRLEWFQGGGGAVIQLFWSAAGAGLQKQIIPQSQLYPEGAPIVVRHPESYTGEHGGTASFVVTASGTVPLAYQWRRNGVDLPGETGPALVFPDVQQSQSGTYAVLVSNVAGSTLSNPATLQHHLYR